MDEFDRADTEAGVMTAEAVLEIPVMREQSLPAPMNDLVQFRDDLVKRHHSGSVSLLDRLRESGGEDSESLMLALIDQLIGETDHLLGNELVATQNGELRDASIISYKRIEGLEKAIKAVQAKRQFEKESGIDLDSPSMMVIFRFFMSKTSDTLVKMGMDPEFRDVFFTAIGVEMESWKKDLREQFDNLRA